MALETLAFEVGVCALAGGTLCWVPGTWRGSPRQRNSQVRVRVRLYRQSFPTDPIGGLRRSGDRRRCFLERARHPEKPRRFSDGFCQDHAHQVARPWWGASYL
eukprot:6538773-Pyramimonas_sp.AAC.1